MVHGLFPWLFFVIENAPSGAPDYRLFFGRKNGDQRKGFFGKSVENVSPDFPRKRFEMQFCVSPGHSHWELSPRDAQGKEKSMKNHDISPALLLAAAERGYKNGRAGKAYAKSYANFDGLTKSSFYQFGWWQGMRDFMKPKTK
jgi:ribosome modulation factor